QDLPPVSDATKLRIMELIAATGERSQLPRLAQLIRDPETPMELVVHAVDTIRKIGLPQDLRPEDVGNDEVDPPVITADEVFGLLEGVPPTRLDAKTAELRKELLEWLDYRRKHGLEGNSYRLGHFDVQPGDWLLMRN